MQPRGLDGLAVGWEEGGGEKKMTVDAVLQSSDKIQAGDFPPFQKV